MKPGEGPTALARPSRCPHLCTLTPHQQLGPRMEVRSPAGSLLRVPWVSRWTGTSGWGAPLSSREAWGSSSRGEGRPEGHEALHPRRSEDHGPRLLPLRRTLTSPPHCMVSGSEASSPGLEASLGVRGPKGSTRSFGGQGLAPCSGKASATHVHLCHRCNVAEQAGSRTGVRCER